MSPKYFIHMHKLTYKAGFIFPKVIKLFRRNGYFNAFLVINNHWGIPPCTQLLHFFRSVVKTPCTSHFEMTGTSTISHACLCWSSKIILSIFCVKSPVEVSTVIFSLPMSHNASKTHNTFAELSFFYASFIFVVYFHISPRI